MRLKSDYVWLGWDVGQSNTVVVGTADRAATEMMIIDNEQAKEGADGVHKQRQSRCHQLRVNNFLMKPREMFPDEA